MASTQQIVDEINAKLKELPKEAHMLIEVAKPWIEKHAEKAVALGFAGGGFFGLFVGYMAFKVF